VQAYGQDSSKKAIPHQSAGLRGSEMVACCTWMALPDQIDDI